MLKGTKVLYLGEPEISIKWEDVKIEIKVLTPEFYDREAQYLRLKARNTSICLDLLLWINLIF